MPSNVTATDDDLGALARWVAVSVVSEPALHPSRHPYRNRGERSTEPLAVEHVVRAPESLRHRFIVAMSPFRRAPLALRRLELEGELRFVACAPRSRPSPAEAKKES
jgi:hypothetical protein